MSGVGSSVAVPARVTPTTASSGSLLVIRSSALFAPEIDGENATSRSRNAPGVNVNAPGPGGIANSEA
jgi:hypothetical protein